MGAGKQGSEQNAMDITIAVARPQDADVLWTMLYYAAQMAQDGATSPVAAQDHPYLRRLVLGMFQTSVTILR